MVDLREHVEYLALVSERDADAVVLDQDRQFAALHLDMSAR